MALAEAAAERMTLKLGAPGVPAGDTVDLSGGEVVCDGDFLR